MNISLILLSAGASSRFQHKVKKQWLRIGSDPLWLKVLNRFESFHLFEEIVITAPQDEVDLFKNYTDCEVVAGGKSRQESIHNAIENISSEFVLISDIARCFIPENMLSRIIESRYLGDIIVPYLSVSDTVVFKDDTIEREFIKLVQTPQLSKTKILKELLQKSTINFTDESTLFAENGFKRYFVEGDKRAEKLTFVSDLTSSTCFDKATSTQIFVGNGFDVHQLEAGEEALKLGGITIQSPLKFKAHSDGDVLIHSLIDAILGASTLGDIGELFPDTNEEYKNIDSIQLLQIVRDRIEKIGYEIVHIDITVIAEIPKLKRYKSEIRDTLSYILDLEKNRISLKATTTEKLGFIGRKEGVAVISNATLKFIDWRDYYES